MRARVASAPDPRRPSPRSSSSAPGPVPHPCVSRDCARAPITCSPVKGPMKHTSVYVAALCMFGLAVAAAPARSQDYPRLALHGRLYGNGFPLILGGTIQGPVNPAALDAFARYHELTIPASPVSEYRPDITQELRLRNPNIKLIAYVIGQHIWD